MRVDTRGSPLTARGLNGSVRRHSVILAPLYGGVPVPSPLLVSPKKRVDSFRGPRRRRGVPRVMVATRPREARVTPKGSRGCGGRRRRSLRGSPEEGALRTIAGTTERVWEDRRRRMFVRGQR